MAAGSVKIVNIDKGYDALLKNMPRLTRITLGIHDKEGSKPEPNSDQGLTVAQAAFVNEFGSSEVPSRPAFRLFIDMFEKRIVTMMSAGIVANSKGTSALRAFEPIGLKMATMIQNLIKMKYGGMYPPNAAYTIRKKKSDVPLIDSGLMNSSIKHNVTVRK